MKISQVQRELHSPHSLGPLQGELLPVSVHSRVPTPEQGDGRGEGRAVGARVPRGGGPGSGGNSSSSRRHLISRSGERRIHRLLRRRWRPVSHSGERRRRAENSPSAPRRCSGPPTSGAPSSSSYSRSPSSTTISFAGRTPPPLKSSSLKATQLWDAQAEE
jgi:hypothetical protein